jgi:hypothetical protein
MPHNDRGYGHWRFAGAFAVVKRQSECGRKTAEMHVSQPVTIGVCYHLGFFLLGKLVVLLSFLTTYFGVYASVLC